MSSFDKRVPHAYIGQYAPSLFHKHRKHTRCAHAVVRITSSDAWHNEHDEGSIYIMLDYRR